MKFDRTKAVRRFNSKVAIPNDRYTLRCLSEKFKRSNAGNPMLEREWEIVLPAEITLGEDTYSLAGTTVMQWRLLGKTDSKGNPLEAETQASLADAVAEWEAAAVDLDIDNLDSDDPPRLLEDGLFEVTLYPRETSPRKTPTPEQKARGEMGDPILDGNGEPIKRYQIQFGELVCPTDPDVQESLPKY